MSRDRCLAVCLVIYGKQLLHVLRKFLSCLLYEASERFLWLSPTERDNSDRPHPLRWVHPTDLESRPPTNSRKRTTL